MIDAVTEAKDYDLRQASPKVLEYLLMTRWLNDVLGNLDVWWGQFMVPQAQDRRYQEMIAIDLDEAFNRMPAETLYDALTNHFGIPPEQIDFEDCGWRDRMYTFNRPVGWAPEHFDSNMGYYSQLWRYYLTGEIDIDLDRVKERVRFAGQIPREAVLNCMQRFIEASAAAGHGEGDTVYLPAADPPDVSRADFERLFVKRLEDSIEQFCSFLDAMKAARNDPKSELAGFYANLKARSY